MLDTYWILRIKLKEDAEEEFDMFVGRIKGEMHLLGYRPRSVAYMFSERECASLDLGIVKFPEGKSLSDLVEGDIINVETEEGKPYWTGLIYQRRG